MLCYVMHVMLDLWDIDINPRLHEFVKTNQTHSYSKSCRKYKHMVCRFNIGQFLTDSAIVAEPLPDDLYEEKKKQLQR